MAGKPRILTDGRDMIWSLIPLILVCGLVVMASGNCSVGLTGTAADDRTAAFDVENALKADASTMAFPIRLPDTPPKWKPNSGSTADVDGHRVSTVGWLSANGAYVQLTQSDATEESLLAYMAGKDDNGTTYSIDTDGPRTVAGRGWVAYSTGNLNKKFWVTDLGDVRIAVATRGPDADLETLATAVLAQAPLQARK
ncbi:DUF4245 domain-containing protein [Gordonia sp. ABSL1-1]|uniref:DUF4245 domain-containing protein n=1 Tax=Gordonia sp. ABSL1-1 TaxID=3053923 RepID=UPI002573B165|nr:DUF4245 domain-containing protein [Gordonia sp. ABSL1-1]MDL9938341.1 DUF4245 domain-containing protein [Gordonia sp. ABSL1-1]